MSEKLTFEKLSDILKDKMKKARMDRVEMSEFMQVGIERLDELLDEDAQPDWIEKIILRDRLWIVERNGVYQKDWELMEFNYGWGYKNKRYY